MGKWLTDPKRNWKTTVGGVLALATVGYKAWVDPKVLADPEMLAIISAGIGLIVAKDGDKSGTASKPNVDAQ